MSLEAIGFLPLLLLPIALKFLWAPLIDLYGFSRWGHYRFWIVCFQLWVVGLTIACSFLTIETHLPLLLLGLTAIDKNVSENQLRSPSLLRFGIIKRLTI